MWKLGKFIIWNPVKALLYTLWRGTKVVASHSHRFLSSACNGVWTVLRFAGRSTWRAIDYALWQPVKFIGGHLWSGAKSVLNIAKRITVMFVSDIWKLVKMLLDQIGYVLRLLYDQLRGELRQIWAWMIRPVLVALARGLRYCCGKLNTYLLSPTWNMTLRAASYSLTTVHRWIILPVFYPIGRTIYCIPSSSL